MTEQTTKWLSHMGSWARSVSRLASGWSAWGTWRWSGSCGLCLMWAHAPWPGQLIDLLVQGRSPRVMNSMCLCVCISPRVMDLDPTVQPTKLAGHSATILGMRSTLHSCKQVQRSRTHLCGNYYHSPFIPCPHIDWILSNLFHPLSRSLTFFLATVTMISLVWRRA
jgi:hypothetical protein